MNHIAVAGRIGKDPEQRTLNDGTAVLSFSVADDQGKDKPAIWWRASLFGKRAESLAPYLTKGSQVTIVGNVTEREYVDKDGQQRKSMEVRVFDIALQGGKLNEAFGQQQRVGAIRGTGAPSQAPRRPAPASSGFDDMDSDMPF
jgi:single-strand DNA-binding protein